MLKKHPENFPYTEEGQCECITTIQQLQALDTRICYYCGCGNIDQRSPGGHEWMHRNEYGCIEEMGKKIQKLEKAFFSRRAAVEATKEKRNG
jgi:hypothetical protein